MRDSGKPRPLRRPPPAPGTAFAAASWKRSLIRCRCPRLGLRKDRSKAEQMQRQRAGGAVSCGVDQPRAPLPSNQNYHSFLLLRLPVGMWAKASISTLSAPFSCAVSVGSAAVRACPIVHISTGINGDVFVGFRLRQNFVGASVPCNGDHRNAMHGALR
jgi:hypothetical protein